jgi:hypothetical protein
VPVADPVKRGGHGLVHPPRQRRARFQVKLTDVARSQPVVIYLEHATLAAHLLDKIDVSMDGQVWKHDRNLSLDWDIRQPGTA